MLEKEIARDMARGITEQAKEAHALRVKSAEIILGTMRVIDDDVMRHELSAQLKDTAADGAEIIITHAPAMMRCRACDTVYPIIVGDPSSYICPSCGSTDRELNSGMELDLGQMQIMVLQDSENSSMVSKMAQAVEAALGPIDQTKKE